MYHFPCTQEATTGVYKTIGGNAPQIKTITCIFYVCFTFNRRIIKATTWISH